jgi:PAS domain S-box-containing protein
VIHPTQAGLQAELFSQLSEPFTGEALFDRLPDVVYFVKNRRGQYVVVNQTLAERCGGLAKEALIGRCADEVFPEPLGRSYREQDERVLTSGEAILNQLELHFYPSGGRGWCLTNKLPLRDRSGRVVGLVGVSKDLQAASEGGKDYAPIAAAVRQIQSNFGGSLRVRQLADQAGLSQYQFEERIRRIFHLTAGQLIQKTRIEAAMKRLRDTNDPIAAVAQDCGYSDQSAFTRQFRQTTGVSPSAYRQAAARSRGPKWHWPG